MTDACFKEIIPRNDFWAFDDKRRRCALNAADTTIAIFATTRRFERRRTGETPTTRNVVIDVDVVADVGFLSPSIVPGWNQVSVGQ